MEKFSQSRNVYDLDNFSFHSGEGGKGSGRVGLTGDREGRRERVDEGSKFVCV